MTDWVAGVDDLAVRSHAHHQFRSTRCPSTLSAYHPIIADIYASR